MQSLAEFPVYAVLPCSDFERARGWYEDKLGLAPDPEGMPGHGSYRCADGTWLAGRSDSATLGLRAPHAERRAGPGSDLELP